MLNNIKNYFDNILTVLISINKKLEVLEKCTKYDSVDGHVIVVKSFRKKY